MVENPFQSPQGEGARSRRKLISDRAMLVAQVVAAAVVIVVYVVLIRYYVIPGLQ